MIDVDGDGTIDQAEFSKLYTTIKEEIQEEHKREVALKRKVRLQKRRIFLIGGIVCVMMIFLGVSVAVNAGVMFDLLERTKETNAADGHLVVKGTSSIAQVSLGDCAAQPNARGHALAFSHNHMY